MFSVRIGSVLSEESLLGLINYIKKNKIRTLLVVDDCRSELHERLASTVFGGEVNLITISSDSAHVGLSTSRHVIEPLEMDEVIYRMLKASEKIRSRKDWENIKGIALQYIKGLPVVAERYMELGRALKPDEFLSHAGIYRSIIEGLTPNANRVLRALSLFPYVGGVHGYLYQQECSLRAIFCGNLDEEYFDDAVVELEDKQLLQRDAQSRILRVVPTPLAAALTSEYLAILSRKNNVVLQKLFESMRKPGLFVPFLQRIDDLPRVHASQIMTPILETLFYYATDKGYRDDSAHIYHALSKVNPDRALIVAERTYRYRLVADTMNMSAACSSDLVHGLAELAWNRGYFERAARLLLHCAALEYKEKHKLYAASRFLNTLLTPHVLLALGRESAYA